MAREIIITGIDIGTNNVTTVISSFNPEYPVPQIIGVGSVPSAGIRKDIITEPEDAIQTIRASIKEAEHAAGVSVSGAFVSVGGDHIMSMESRGVVAVSRADSEISDDDIARVISAAETVALPKNREILHNIPREFIVDGEGSIRDAVGMNGMRLEATTLLVGGSSAHIKSIASCVAEAGVDVEGYVLAPLAAAYSVLSKKQKELGVLCLDIGGGTTNLAVFEEGNLVYTNVLPLGGDNITNDLAIGLKINVDVAERLKKEYGMALLSEVSKRDTIDLSQFDPETTENVSRKDVVEIMEARLNEIFDLANNQLRNIGREAFLPGGVVLVGGSAKVPHIVDLCRAKMRLPVQIGFPKDVEGIAASVDDPSYATALGLIFYGFENANYSTRKVSLPGLSFFGKAGSYVKKWIKALLP